MKEKKSQKKTEEVEREEVCVKIQKKLGRAAARMVIARRWYGGAAKMTHCS